MDKRTERTILKITLGFLIVMLLGMSVFLVTALVTNKNATDFNEEDAEDEGEDVPITGNALEQASAVALKYIGEGRVTDTEVGDEEGYYEIEITLDDGSEVDVHLDENFRVLSSEYEDKEEDDD